jgi:hypothetical protein
VLYTGEFWREKCGGMNCKCTLQCGSEVSVTKFQVGSLLVGCAGGLVRVDESETLEWRAATRAIEKIPSSTRQRSVP